MHIVSIQLNCISGNVWCYIHWAIALLSSVTVASPRSVLWGLFPVVGTRYSGCVQRAPGDWWYYRTYTGASASESHTPDLENTHIITHKCTDFHSNCLSLTTGTETSCQDHKIPVIRDYLLHLLHHKQKVMWRCSREMKWLCTVNYTCSETYTVK